MWTSPKDFLRLPGPIRAGDVKPSSHNTDNEPLLCPGLNQTQKTGLNND